MAYNVLFPTKVITAGDMSASITSQIVEIRYQDNLGVQLHWTGTPTGTFAIQISSNYTRDANGNVTNTGNWISLPLNPAIAASGSADDAYVDLTEMSAMYLRVVYTAVSGSGSLDCYVVGKGV